MRPHFSKWFLQCRAYFNAMSAPSPAPSTSSASVRRRRPATACTSCRDRRVSYMLQHCPYRSDNQWQIKCDHAHPACFQCTKRGRDCQYPGPTPTTVEFVTEPLSLATGLGTNNSASSQTWRSVIEQQVDLVKRSNIKANSQGSGVPFWTLAEVEEVHTIRLELA